MLTHIRNLKLCEEDNDNMIIKEFWDQSSSEKAIIRFINELDPIKLTTEVISSSI